ncbi:Uma2 family endonuclease [Desulfococcaceae bacterium HSG8]|nr:Uma2 family endonuclease [Desulfococcaceae bacterium HSG8]
MKQIMKPEALSTLKGAQNYESVCLNPGSALKQPDAYSVFSELTLLIDDKDYIPDICIYPKRRMVFGTEDIVRMTEMPSAVIEVLSPSQTFQDALEKFAICFKAGIRSCWLVVPTMTVTVYEASETFQMFHDGEVIDSTLDVRIPFDVIFE